MSAGDDSQALLSRVEEDELWLISYADLLTLLVGFFVLLLAASPPKLSRLEKLAASLSGEEAAPLTQLKERVDELVQEKNLQDRIVTREDAEGLGIEFKDAVLFDSGSADIRPEARKVMAEIAALLKALPERSVIVEGHTDDVPIHTPAFGSNWALGAQRGTNVLLALQESGVAQKNVSVRSFADTRPVTLTGPTEQRRAQNRRVVIRVE